MSQSDTPPGQQPPSGWGAAPDQPGWQPQSSPPPPAWGPPPSGGWGPPGPSYSSYGWGGPPPAPKPGVIPLRPLGVGDILEGTFTVLRRYPGATLGSAVLLVGLVSVAQLLLFIPLAGALDGVLEAAELADAAGVQAELGAVSWLPLTAAIAAVTLLSILLFVLLTGVMSVVVGQAAVGAALSLSGAFARALPRLPRLLGVSVLVVLALSAPWVVVVGLWAFAFGVDAGIVYAIVVLATLAAVPVTVLLGIKLALATPAVALESVGGAPISPVTALRRSWGLVRGAWWRTLGILLLAGIIAGALSQVVAIPASFVVSVLPLTVGVAVVGTVVASALGQAIAQPVSGLVLALVYVDRRIRTEQLDVALAQAAGVELSTAPQTGQQQPPQ